MSGIEIKSNAEMSECGTYRFFLQRSWDEALHTLPICMLNPSDGDADKNDPTISRLIKFAQRWGYGGLAIVNLYPFRTRYPTDLWAAENRSAEENDQWLDAIIVIAENNGNKLLVAWGDDGNWESQADRFLRRVGERSKTVEIMTLGRTMRGNPRHPAARGPGRVPDDQEMAP